MTNDNGGPRRPYETEVARGIALLQEREPGTLHKVDLEVLDLGNPWRCPLGQTWAGESISLSVYGIGPYAAHATALFGPGGVGEAMRHGFVLPASASDDTQEEWDELTAEWVRQLSALRSPETVGSAR